MMLPHSRARASGQDARWHRPGRIVVGVDFSEPSLAVTGWVARHLAPHADLALVHVTRAPRPSAASRDHHDRIRERGALPVESTQALRGALRGLASLVGGDRVTVDVRAGDPATELAAYADRVDADLIVVGVNAAYRVAAYYERAMTERLLDRSNRPVLIARGVPPAAPTTVLAAVAGDADATPVLRAAWMVAAACDARVVALHVTDESRRVESEDRVRRWLNASDVPLAKSSAIVAQGATVRGILAVARQMHAEVIAVGVRTSGSDMDGDDNVGGGDTARALARAATCSVLVVRRAAACTPPPAPPRRRNPTGDDGPEGGVPRPVALTPHERTWSRGWPA